MDSTEPKEQNGAEPVSSTDWMGDPERTETVKKINRWEVRSRTAGEAEWHNAGSTVQREEVDLFLKRAKKNGWEVQVWLMVSVERTETVKRLESGPPN